MSKQRSLDNNPLHNPLLKQLQYKLFNQYLKVNSEQDKLKLDKLQPLLHLLTVRLVKPLTKIKWVGNQQEMEVWLNQQEVAVCHQM